MAPLEKSNEYTMLSAVYVSASNGRSSTGSRGGRVEENMLLIYTKARMSRSAIMANGTLLDASLSDISPLSSSLFLISSKKKVHRVVLFPAPK